MFLVSLS